MKEVPVHPCVWPNQSFQCQAELKIYEKQTFQMEKQKLVNTWLRGSSTCLEGSPYTNGSTCKSTCCDAVTVEKCNCSIPSSKDALQRQNDRDISVCSPMQRYKCFSRFHNEITEDQQKCRNKCLTPCTYVSYRKSYSTMSSSDGVQNNSKSQIHLTVYFESFDITVIEEIVSVTVASVLANVGGAMGVFIGASIISLVELLGFMSRWIYTVLWTRSNTVGNS